MWSTERREMNPCALVLCFALLCFDCRDCVYLSLSLSLPLSLSLSGVPSILNPNTGMLPKRHVHHNIAACLGQRSVGDVRPQLLGSMGFGVWVSEPGSGVLQRVIGVQARRQGLRDCEGFLLSGWKAVEGGASTGLRVRPRFREIQL